jgi:hypothetical protein
MSGHGRREAAWQLNAILWHDRVYADVHGEQGSSGAMPMIPPIGRAMSSPPWPAHEYIGAICQLNDAASQGELARAGGGAH